MQISVAIPTYKRPDELKRCIASAVSQTLPPAEVLVIDDDVLSEQLLEELRRDVEAVGAQFVYRRKDHSKEPRGLSLSRHIALEIAANDVLIIDDDIVLEKECLERMAHARQQATESGVIGIAGVIRNNRRKGLAEKFINSLFGLTSALAWDVNAVGYQVWDDFITERQKGHYAHGGFCLYDRSLALGIGFPQFQGGRPGLEDVYFSLHAKQEGLCYVVEPRAGCLHLHGSGGRDGEYLTGYRESVNRRVIFRELCGKGIGNRIRFCWASFGWTLRQFLAGHWSKGWGMVAGFIAGKKRW